MLKPERLVDQRERLYSDPPISLARKLGYGVGGLPKTCLSAIYNVYYMPFMLNIVGLPAGYVSIVVAITRGLDALSDPLLGLMVSRVPPSRIGKYRPWILGSLPLALSAYMLLWYIPPWSTGWLVVYYIIVYWIYAVGSTLYYVPYSSVCLTLSNSQRERDSLIAFRMFFEVAGNMVGLALQAAVLYIGDSPANACIPRSIIDLIGLVTDRIDYRNPAIREFQVAQMKVYMTAAAVGCAIFVICATCTFAAIFERYTLHNTNESRINLVNVYRQYFNLLKFTPFLWMVMCFLTLSMAFAVVNNIYSLFYNYVLHSSNLFSIIIFGQYSVGFLCVPIWHLLSKKIGKKIALAISILALMLVLFMHLFIVGKLVYLILAASGFALAMGGATLIPAAMFPDCVLAYTLAQGHGHETLFYATNNFLEKLGSGLTLGLSTLALQISDYVNGACDQPESVIITLRVLISIFPVVVCCVSLLFLYKYPIGEAHRSEMEVAVKKSLGNLATSASRASLLSGAQSTSDYGSTGIPKES